MSEREKLLDQLHLERQLVVENVDSYLELCSRTVECIHLLLERCVELSLPELNQLSVSLHRLKQTASSLPRVYYQSTSSQIRELLRALNQLQMQLLSQSLKLDSQASVFPAGAHQSLLQFPGISLEAQVFVRHLSGSFLLRSGLISGEKTAEYYL